MENKKNQEVQKRALLKAILEKKKKSNIASNSIQILTRKKGKNYFIPSYEQKRLWFIYKLNPDSIAYNIHCGFRIYGDLKIDLLQEAIKEVGMDQESLRTRFQYIDNELMQVVEPNFIEKIKYIDLSNVDSEKIEDELQRVSKEESYKAFDLENEALVRFILIETAPKERLFIIVIHHIIFDGWSMGVFYKNLSEKYNSLCNGKHSLNKEKTVQYADYANWQRKELSKNKLDKQFSYWKNKLQNIDQNVEFPPDKKRPSMITSNGNVVFFELDNDIVKSLRKYSAKCNCTVNTILLSTFKCLVYKYTKQNNITIGTAVANRKVDGIENIIGFFVNTIVLNTEIDGDMKFPQLLEKVRDTTLEAYDNEDFPFDQLVEKINPLRDSSRNPFFQLMFTYQNTPKSKVELQDLRVEEYALGSRRSAVDITLNIEENGNRIFGVFEYNSDLFYEETIQRICNQFKLILKDVLSDDDKIIDDISILNEEEENIILNKFNDTYVEYDKTKTVVDMFEEQVEKTPNNIAVVFENEAITYKKLNERANSLARVLIGKGVGPDDIIGIMVERSINMIVGIMAIVKAGGAYLPIDPEYPKDRIEYILNNSEAKIILIQNRFKERIKQEIVICDVDDEQLYKGNIHNLKRIANENNLAYVIYTSGTTGKPKGVMIEHGSIMNRINWMQRKYNISSNDVILQKTTYTFDVSVWEVFWWSFVGATVRLLIPGGEKDPNIIAKNIKEGKVTVIHFVPSMFNVFMEYIISENKTRDINSLEKVFTSGEELKSEQSNLFNEKIGKLNNTKLVNLYGPTEAAVDVTYYDCKENEEVVPIGKPIDNIRLYIVDKNKCLIPIGVVGELCISGVGLARGYLNNEKLTEEKFVDNPHEIGQKMYKTGDLAKWLPDGNIEYLGRIDEQVKIRGFRIELGEITNVLRRIDYIKDVAVIAREDSVGEKAIYGYIVSDINVDFKKVKKEIRKKLPDYMIPAYMMQIEQVPVNGSGKLDKRVLPEIAYESKEEYIAPRNEIEKIIVRIFEEVIGINNISVDADFFEIGGHSLRATKVANRIESKTGVRIPINIIFSERTVEYIAIYIENCENREYESIQKAEEQEYYQMSSAQRSMYLIWQMDKESTVYNMPAGYKLEGTVIVDNIKNALQKIIDRHEILRTCFLMEDGKLVQKVFDEVEAGYSYEESKREIYQIIDEFTKPFNLDKGNLVRMKVVKSEEQYYLLIDMHHIVSDGMSMGIFVKEFSTLYNGGELEELSLQYKDYSEWMRGRNLDSQKEYWVSQFDGETPVIDLPYDYNRPVEQSHEGAITSIEIKKEIKNGIKELCKITGATEYMVLLASFMVVLNKYTRQEDIIVGTPISGRTNKDMESMMGMFVNTLVMRERPEDQKSFIKFLYEVKESCLRAYENQEYPFEQLVEDVEVRRDFSRNPLFDVTFGVQNNEKFDISMDNIRINQISGEHRISKYDLSVIMESSEEGYFVYAEYCTALFKKETINRLLAHLKEALCREISNPEMLIGEIQIITKEEEELILNKFNETYVEYDKEKTVVDLFEEQISKNLNKIAVVYEEDKLTYKELNEKVNVLGAKLRDLGIKPNDFVAIVAERSLEMVIGILAIIKAGAAYVPIDPKYPEERIQYILSDCKAKILLTYKEGVKFEEISVINLADNKIFEGEPKNLEKINIPEDLLYLIYTSGTTGKPKGIMVKHSNIINYCSNNEKSTMSGILKWKLNNMGSVTNMCFDIFATEIIFVLVNGMTTFIANSDEQVDVKYLSSFIERNNIEILQTTPSRIRILLSQPERLKTLISLKYIIVGGEIVESDMVNKVHEYTGAVVKNAYGPSETTISSTSHELSRNIVENNISIGKPIANTQVYILQGLDLCGINVPGELCIAGDGVAKGYLNKPELTAEKFISNPYGEGELYRTGDLARWVSDGNIEYLGRIDEQVKIRGFRIELEEIASVLRKIDYINDVAIITRKDASGEKAIYAYVVSDKNINFKKVKKEIRKELPDYMVPAYMMQIEGIPVNRNGKLDKRALPDIVIESIEEYIAPRYVVEKTLVEIWQSVLGVNTIGINDDFFNLGGDSIKSIQVISRAKAKGYYFEVKDLFKNSNIKDLSKNIKHNVFKINQDEVVGEVDITPIQKWFFEMNFEEEYYWNQSMMLFNKDGFEKELIEKSFNAIAIHHDAFRIVYKNENSEIKQINRGIDENLYDLNIYDYRDSEAIDENEIKEMCNRIQGSINLEEGPLVKLGLFKSDQGDHLLIAIHHLVIDGVSWRILFEDLQQAYVMAKNGQKIILQEKTTSFKEWGTKQKEYANTYKIKKQLAYWNNIESEDINELPKDKYGGKSKFCNLRSIRAKLTKEETKKMLKYSNKAYDTEINDILLSTLSLTISQWTREKNTLINLESHGREEIIKNVDITRTIGWFTSQYPVVLKNSGTDLGALIKNTKDLLRRIPNKGIDYGIIKYLSKDEIKNKIKFKLKPEICFNYLGQFDEDINNDIFNASHLSTGESISLNNRSLNSLDFSAILIDKSFKLNIIYSYNDYNEETIKLLSDNYKTNLIKIIDHCLKKEQCEKTAADITNENISLAELKPYLKDINNIKNIYTLTPMQEGMLYHTLVDVESEAYHESLALKIKGDLDVNILEESFNKLIARHDILRTIFDNNNFNKNMQIVFNERRTNIIYEDISEENIDKEAYTNDVISADKRNRFKLNKDILIRLAVIKVEKDVYRLILSNHHIILDGWCLSILIFELFKVYNELKYGYDSELKEVPPYSNYIEWLNTKNDEDAEEYWKNYLLEYNEVTEIPFKNNLKIEDYKNSELSYNLDQDITNKIEKIAKNSKVTVNTIIQSIWSILLQKYNNSDDIVFGYVVSGRNPEVKDIENMLGLFINTIPLRVKIEDDMSFKDLLININKSFIESNEYDYYPLAKIQNLSEVKEKLINNIMVFENYPVDDEGLNDELLVKNNLEIIDFIGLEETNYNFNLIVSYHDNILIKFQFNELLYSNDSVERVKNHFINLVNEIITDENILVKDIEILGEDERNKVLVEFNNTKIDYPRNKTIQELFEEQVKKTPNNVAVVYEKEKLTYKELNKKVNILGLKLREIGIKPNDFVAISTERSLEMVIGILAIIKAGGAYVPIDPKYPEDRIQYIFSDCKPKALLTYKVNVNFKGIPVIDITDNKVFEGEIENLTKVNRADDILYLIYTSGTTGKPKGVMVKHSNMVNHCSNNKNNALAGVFNRKLNNMGSVTNMSFDIFGTETILVFVNGMTTFIANNDEQEDVEYLSAFIERNSIEILQTTPSRIKILLSQPEKLKTLKSLKYVIVGGETVEFNLVSELYEYTDVVVKNAYGPSETTIISTANELSRNRIEKNISIGKPIANTQVYMLQGLNLCGIGVQGELCIAGDGVTKGYLNNPELTAEKFIDNPYGGGKLYRTGDLARWLPNGNLEYLGRIDEQVKIRGFRIELGEISNILSKIDYINDVAVIARKDASGEKAIYGYIVSDINVNFKKVRKEIREELPDYMIPAYMMQIEEIPVNRNGKLDKRALLGITKESKEEYIAPKNGIEELIVRIFEEVIGGNKISVDADFFEIGGHSLRATKVANRIEAEIGVRIPIKIIFSERTAESIAGYIVKCGDKEYKAIQKAEYKKYYPMSSAQKRIYLIWQMKKESTVYNIPECYKLEDNIRIDCIKNSLQKMIDRHEILRTCFVMEDGELVQKILDKVEANYSYEESMDEVSETLKKFIKPFALAEGDLVRMKVVKSKKEYYLLIDMHHIISDGMSMGIFIKEFSTIYNGGELEELSLQYKDYSEWMSVRNLDSQKEYWVSQFEDEAPVIDLPYDYKRSVEQSYEGAITSIELHKEIKNGIKELCKITGATEYMVLLASFMVVLNKYTRQEDIVIGTPISGRTNKDMESIMGMFVNTLAIREKPEAEKSFLKFVDEVKESCLKAYENQEYPFEELVEAVEVRRDFSRNPLFDVMFMLQNNEEFNLLMDGIKLEQIGGEHRISKFDLSLIIGSSEHGYFVGAEYCTALFKGETIDRFLVHFKEVLCKVIDNPESLIGEIEVITKEEEKLILNKFNDTCVEYDKTKTIVDMFEEQVEKTPNNIAVVYEEEKLTYKELNEKVNILGTKLRGFGIKSDDFIAISAERSLEMIIGILAIIKAGGAYVPVDPKYPEDRINYILSDCKPKVLLTYKADIKVKGIPIVDLADNKALEGHYKNLEKVNSSNDLLYVIYTSGTTGKPKGVMVKHSNMVNYCLNNKKSALDGVVNGKLNNMGSVTNMTFDIFGTEIIWIFINGMTTFIANNDEQEEAEYLSSFIERNSIEILQTTPSRIKILLSQPEKLKNLNSLKYIILCGEKLESNVVNKLYECTNAVVENAYGPSETTILSTANELSANIEEYNISIGKPITNTQVYILQELNLCGI
ncbi:non-ribosomal peptide synthetase, partial [Clostridium gasigenes]